MKYCSKCLYPNIAVNLKIDDSSVCSSCKSSKKFINLNTPIIGYIKKNQFHIDLKAIPKDQFDLLIKSIELI